MKCLQRHMRTVLIWLIAGVLVTMVYSESGQSVETASDTTGPKIYRALSASGVLDNYLQDLVEEVIDQLMGVAREWPGYQVNGPYQQGYVNVYLIDSKRLSRQKLAIDAELKLDEPNLAGNAITHENSATIFIDTGMLKEYLAAVMRKRGTGMPLINAVAEVRVQGLDHVRDLWDPAINPRLKARPPVEDWLNFYRGMLGFVLAHELGHLHLGKPVINEGTNTPTLSNKQDMDLRWACWDTLGAKFRALQQVEAQADSYAAHLIAQVLFPEGALRAPLLWYELGAQTYLLYTLNAQFLDVLNATESHYIQRALQIQLGTELYSSLVVQAESLQRERGALHIVFPKAHPTSVRRMEQLLQVLAKSPYSYHHGQSPYSSDLIALAMIIDPACAELKRKYGIQ